MTDPYKRENHIVRAHAQKEGKLKRPLPPKQQQQQGTQAQEAPFRGTSARRIPAFRDGNNAN